MEKKHKDLVIKGMRLLRQGAIDGEQLAQEGLADEVLVQLETIIALAATMKRNISLHVGAQQVLKDIAVKRPKVAAKIGRPKLSLVKG